MDERSFHTLFTADTVVLGLDADSREGVVTRLVDAVVASGRISAGKRKDVLEAVLARESLGSTGIGAGMAIPHAKTDQVTSVVTAVGVARRGIDFKAVDGEACDLFFLILSPKTQHDDHLAILRWLSRLKRHEDFSRFLRSAKSAEDVISIFEEVGH